MKNVWLLNHYTGAPSLGIGFRPYYLAQALQSHGVRICPVGAAFHHCLRDPIVQKELLRKINLDGIDYVWVKTPAYKNTGVRRICNMFSYAWRVWRQHENIEKLIGKPDVILVSSSHPLHIVFAKWMAKKYRVKLIFEVRDLWPLSLIEILGVSKFHPLVLLLSWLERYAYKNSDAVVSLLPYAKKYMLAHGMAERKFHYIPNGIDIKEAQLQVELSPPLKKHLQMLENEKIFIVMYVGAHGKPNALDTLVETAGILKQRGGKKIQFVLIGDGGEKEKLTKKANELKLDNVTFFSSIPKTQIQAALSYANITFIAFLDLQLYQYGISCNKLFDYMLAKKAILVEGSFQESPVLEANAGIHIPCRQPELIAAELMKARDMRQDELQIIGENGYRYMLENHSYDVLAKKYKGLLVNSELAYNQQNN